MEEIKMSVITKSRINVLDALRGFALLGVILIHMLQKFGIRSMPTGELIPLFPAADAVFQWIGENIIMGRFVNIFAFLFGLSFFIQMDSSAKKGLDFRGRFVWRMLLLFLLGVLAHSFYSLEIISVYAVFGLLMIPLYKLKNWILIIIAFVFLLGAPRLIQAELNNNSAAAKSMQAGTPTAQVPLSTRPAAPQGPVVVPEHLANPSFINSAKFHYEERFTGKLNYQFGMIGRGFLTFAMFIFGLVVGKIRFFEKLELQKVRNRNLFFGFVIATVLVNWIISMLPAVETRILFRPAGQFVSPDVLLMQVLQDLNLVLFSGALAMGFILLYQTRTFGKYLDLLSPYGRMGLSNYIMQGLIGAFLFSMWAFGPIFNKWGVTELFILGIVIYILQIIFSKFWLKHFYYGPLEWAWRSATYLKAQPFKR